MLKINDLIVSYGDIKVVHGISMYVDEGECVALLGSNGAGKTTILKAISGIINYEGSIYFEGIKLDLFDASERYEKGLIQVPEGGKLFPYMTVKENLLLGASCRDDAWNKRYETLSWIYSVFPRLYERGNQQARLLSGGERQMLAIARGLMACPKLLIIDEPSLGLAPKVLLESYRILRSLIDRGLTIFLSEQNVHQAVKIASRAYVIENGRIVMSGTKDEIVNSPHIKKAYLGM